ncbi:MAG: hypothetical protein LBU51_00455 [Bacteroidales bacterium]|nr:hypothetical protein [Bacteroidales bacterium]
MTKEEFLRILTSGKSEDFAKYLEMDEIESKKLAQEIAKDQALNIIIPSLEDRILGKVVSKIDDITLAKALKLATEQTKEKIFANLAENKLKKSRNYLIL